MTKIDLSNNIVEFNHKEAFDTACFLLSYIHTQNPYHNQEPEKFLESFCMSYQDFLNTKKPTQRFKNDFEKIREKSRLSMKMLENALIKNDKKTFSHLIKEFY